MAGLTFDKGKVGMSAVTSKIGIIWSVIFPTLPRPACCLLECHQRKSNPNDVFAHRTKAFSNSADFKRIDSHARPPMVLRGVNCIAVGWLLN